MTSQYPSQPTNYSIGSSESKSGDLDAMAHMRINASKTENQPVMNQSSTTPFRLFELLPTDPTFGVMDYFDHGSFIRLGRTSKGMKETVLNQTYWWTSGITGGGLLTIQQLPKNITKADPSHRYVMDVGQRLGRSLLRFCRTKAEWFRAPSLNYFQSPQKFVPGLGMMSSIERDSPIYDEPYVSAAELESLASIPNLRILDAMGHIRFNDMDRLGRIKIMPPKWNWLLERSNLLRHLAILRLGSSHTCQIDLRSMELISQLPNLHTFSFDCSLPMSPVGLFAPLHRSTSLRTLLLTTDFFDADRCHLTDLKKCTNLTSLGLCCFELLSQDFVKFFTHSNIAGPLEYLALQLFDRDQGRVHQLDPASIFQPTFTALTSLRCLWLAMDEHKAGGINQLLPYLIYLPQLSELIITFNVGMLKYMGLGERDAFLPTMTNLQRLSDQANIERICLENIDDSGESEHFPMLIQLLREFREATSTMPKVLWNSKNQIQWRLPKQLEQMRQD